MMLRGMKKYFTPCTIISSAAIYFQGNLHALQIRVGRKVRVEEDPIDPQMH